MYKGKENARINAKCPFFVLDGKQYIKCEPLIEGMSCTKLEFRNEGAKDHQLLKCCLQYENHGCAIREALEKKYK